MADAIAEFLSYHAINLDEWLWGRALLTVFLTGRAATSQAIAAAPGSVLEKEPSFGLLHQLGERACEHIAGSIACFATKNAASAELAARAAVEISVNIRFMLSGDRNSRVVAWIRDYVRNDEKQINHWEKAIAHLSEAEKQQCVPRIATRRKLQQLRKGWLKGAEREFAQFGPVNLNEPWPKIVDRSRGTARFLESLLPGLQHIKSRRRLAFLPRALNVRQYPRRERRFNAQHWARWSSPR
jgi:hypothetical protein